MYGFYLHLLKPPLDDPLRGRVRLSTVSCISTAVHWTLDCWQNSRGQGGPSNESITEMKYRYTKRRESLDDV